MLSDAFHLAYSASSTLRQNPYACLKKKKQVFQTKIVSYNYLKKVIFLNLCLKEYCNRLNHVDLNKQHMLYKP